MIKILIDDGLAGCRNRVDRKQSKDSQQRSTAEGRKARKAQDYRIHIKSRVQIMVHEEATDPVTAKVVFPRHERIMAIGSFASFGIIDENVGKAFGNRILST